MYRFSGDGGPATSARLRQPIDVALDAAGNLYIADLYNHRIRMVNTDGDISTVAGNGTRTYGGDDGPAISASLNSPEGVTADAAGNLYIADTFNHRIRKVAVLTNDDGSSKFGEFGNISTVAGTGTAGYLESQDGGPATSAQLNRPAGVALDAAGNLYIADSSNHRIRKVGTDGNISTVAGNGTNYGAIGDGGPATSARLDGPAGVALDAAGNLYVTPSSRHRIRMVAALANDDGSSKFGEFGNISTVAGTGKRGDGGDGGPAVDAQLNRPAGVALDGVGNIYIADTDNARIRKVVSPVRVTLTATPSVIASGQRATLTWLSPGAASAEIDNDVGTVTPAAGGAIQVSPTETTAYTVTVTFADDSTAMATATVTVTAKNDAPTAHAGPDQTVNEGDTVILTGSGSDPEGGGFTYAWTQTSGETVTLSYAAAAKPTFTAPTELLQNAVLVFSLTVSDGVHASPPAAVTVTVTVKNDAPTAHAGPDQTVNEGDTVILTGSGSDPEGGGFTYAWTQTSGETVTLSGANTASPSFTAPTGLLQNAVLIFSLTVSDVGNAASPPAAVTVTVTPGESAPAPTADWIIETVAGTGESGYSGDTGPAISAQLGYSTSVAFDAAGNLYVADYGNDRIRKVDTAGNISTVAGPGGRGSSEDGVLATHARINPVDIAFDAAGNLYICFGTRVRKVDTGGVITTVAGNGTPGYSRDGGPATSAQLGYSAGVALDATGNLYIADSRNHNIRKVEVLTNDDNSSKFGEFGDISTVAGTGTAGFSGDGNAAAGAQLSDPRDLALDAAGNLYIADSDNHRIHMIDTAGNISTVAGTGTGGFSGDFGPAPSASLNSPEGVMVDAAGNLYIADIDNHRIRMVSVLTNHDDSSAFGAFSNISTIAGTGTAGYSGDGGPAVNAQLNSTNDLALDAAGNLYIADARNRRIRRIVPPVRVTLTATPSSIISGRGQNATLRWSSPDAVRAEIDNSVGVVAPAAGGAIPVSPTETTTYTVTVTFADNSTATASATVIVIPAPTGHAQPVADWTIETIAGTGTAGYLAIPDGGRATSALLNRPAGIALDAAGNLYIADERNHAIRKVDTAGNISTVAGDGVWGDSGDGNAATSARLANPIAVELDAAGNLYVAEYDNHIIRKIEVLANYDGSSAFGAFGGIHRVAGIQYPRNTGDGNAAVEAEIAYPTGIALDAAGNLYLTSTDDLADTDKGVDTGLIRKVEVLTNDDDSSKFGEFGNISTFAAGWHTPFGMAFDAAGNLYVADYGNHRIRMIDTAGNISTIAGTGTSAFSGDGGAATSAWLNHPRDVALDAAGNLYIADTWNHRIRMVAVLTNDDGSSKFGEFGNIYTVVGTGTQGYGGDGNAAGGAQLDNPAGVALDAAGNLYISDTRNHRIRMVAAPVRVTLTAAPSAIAGGQSTTLTWSSPDAVSAAIDNGVGTVSPAAGGAVEVLPTETTTYAVTVTFADGSTAMATATVAVTPVNAPSATLTADPTAITAGQSSTLTVASANAQSAVIEPGNHTVNLDASGAGSVTVSPTTTTTYTLTVTDANNVTATDTAVVTVIPAPGPPAANWIIETVAGTGTAGYLESQDGGPATSAQLNYPNSVALDAAGNLYISDVRNHRVRKVDIAGNISTVAGTGTAGYLESQDGGPATSAQLNYPNGVALDAAGNLYYISDRDITSSLTV